MFESIGGLNVFQGGISETKKREERKDNRVRIEDVIVRQRRGKKGRIIECE